MRSIREVTAEEENFRTEPFVGSNCRIIRRDFVKPEPEGTIILLPFKIVGYDKDCDGSAMARLENIELNGDDTGWSVSHIGLYGGGFVVSLEELKQFTEVEGEL